MKKVRNVMEKCALKGFCVVYVYDCGVHDTEMWYNIGCRMQCDSESGIMDGLFPTGHV